MSPHSNLNAYGELPICYVRVLIAMQVTALKVELKFMQMHLTEREHDKLQVDILFANFEIGRASCRERVCLYV